jgi:hypothetical protein
MPGSCNVNNRGNMGIIQIEPNSVEITCQPINEPKLDQGAIPALGTPLKTIEHEIKGSHRCFPGKHPITVIFSDAK